MIISNDLDRIYVSFVILGSIVCGIIDVVYLITINNYPLINGLSMLVCAVGTIIVGVSYLTTLNNSNERLISHILILFGVAAIIMNFVFITIHIKEAERIKKENEVK
jgi:ABC-type spermidine/putrescine transport system permease subunit II